MKPFTFKREAKFMRKKLNHLASVMEFRVCIAKLRYFREIMGSDAETVSQTREQARELIAYLVDVHTYVSCYCIPLILPSRTGTD